MNPHRNVLGTPLEMCSIEPMTGFTREGSCKVTADDYGIHGVCVQVTAEFLEFSRSKGNDLSTPMPLAGFPGLQPGDRWCLCALRWKEALDMARHRRSTWRQRMKSFSTSFHWPIFLSIPSISATAEFMLGSASCTYISRAILWPPLSSSPLP